MFASILPMRTALAAFLCLLSPLLFAARVEKKTLTSRGSERQYFLFAPDNLAAGKSVPLLITLHGSGRNGASLVEKWKGLAAKEGFVVAGPDSVDTKQWISPADGPQLLYDLVEELKKTYAIDGRRVYLFGHSGGGSFALQIGLLESEYFAAAAIHAGVLQPAAYGLTDYATRKIPFALVIGTKDALVPVTAVRATRDHLQKSGFTAELTELTNHTHDYYGRAESINRASWEFLQQHPLTADPKFTVYSNLQ